LTKPSVVLGDQVRTIARERLDKRPAGRASSATLSNVEDRLRMLLDL
jgi:mRNA-degrading endonuclease toxin of MazEF toxin-antitoxin module